MIRTFHIACWREEGGIYEMKFDTSTGRIVSVGREAEGSHTSYFEREGDILYALSEIPGPGLLAGKVESFRVTPGGLEKIDTLTGIPSGCPHLRLIRGGRYLAVTSYQTGAVCSAGVDGGRFGPVVSLLDYAGRSADPVRQDRSHGHMLCPTPDGEYLVCVDLGTDELRVYAAKENGALEPRGTVKVPAGYGPRHMVFSPDGTYAYVVCEIKYRLLTYRYPGGGAFEPVNDLTVIPDLEDGQDAGGAIKMSADGKALFISNRGPKASSIDILSLADPERPVKTGAFTACSHPRDFMFFSEGDREYLLCLNMTKDTAEVLSFDPGALTFTPLDATDAIPMPVCVTE